MIYVSSSCIKKKKIVDILREFGNAGIFNIELSGGTLYYDTLVQDLVDLKKEYSFNYVCHAYFPPPKEDFVVNLASCNDVIYNMSIQHYKNCIEMMRIIGCNVLSLHAGFLTEIEPNEIGKEFDTKVVYDKEPAIERFCKAFKNIEMIANCHGIEMYLENNVLSFANYNRWGKVNHMLMTDYDSIMDMKKHMEFNLLLDLGHLHVSSHSLGKNYEQECNMLKSHAAWIHLSHNNGVIDEHKILFEQSPVFKEFLKLNCGVNVTLETKGSVEQLLDNQSLVDRLGITK